MMPLRTKKLLLVGYTKGVCLTLILSHNDPAAGSRLDCFVGGTVRGVQLAETCMPRSTMARGCVTRHHDAEEAAALTNSPAQENIRRPLAIVML